MKLYTVSFTFIAFLIKSIFLRKTKADDVVVETNDEYPYWNKYSANLPTQGASSACQTFAVLHSMQFCLNNKDKTDAIKFDPKPFYTSCNYKEEHHQIETALYHVKKSHPTASDGKAYTLNSNSEAMKKDDYVYDEETLSMKRNMNPKPKPRDFEKQMFDFVLSNLKKGPVLVSVNDDLMNFPIIKGLSSRLENFDNLTKKSPFLGYSFRDAGRSTHVVIIANAHRTYKISKKDDPKFLFEFVDSNESKPYIVTEAELKSYYLHDFTAIHCETVVQAKSKKIK